MKNYALTGLKRLTAISLALAVLCSSSLLVSAAPTAKAMTAEIIVSGSDSVLLNGEQVLSGRTFQSTGLITTSEKGSAVLNLGKLGRINLAPGSALNLNLAENSISGSLTAGKMQVFNTAGVAVNITTPDNVVTNENAPNSAMTVDVTSGTTRTAQTKDDDDDDDDKGAFWLVVIFAGVVGTAAVLVATRGDDDSGGGVISPVR